jgi:chorismate mutase
MAEQEPTPGRPGTPDGPTRPTGPAAADGETDPRARLDALRKRILEVDEALVALVGERRDLVLEVGRLKLGLGLPVMDPAREAQVVRRAAELARQLGVDEELVRDVIWRIIASARDAQEGQTRWGPPAAEGDRELGGGGEGDRGEDGGGEKSGSV